MNLVFFSCVSSSTRFFHGVKQGKRGGVALGWLVAVGRQWDSDGVATALASCASRREAPSSSAAAAAAAALRFTAFSHRRRINSGDRRSRVSTKLSTVRNTTVHVQGAHLFYASLPLVPSFCLCRSHHSFPSPLLFSPVSQLCHHVTLVCF